MHCDEIAPLLLQGGLQKERRRGGQGERRGGGEDTQSQVAKALTVDFAFKK